ncbi:CrcB family protein [Alicyclobacillus fastidiosus]|uniref:Fluoride-specific ion channel n=1 Tax=Alicyclobacillus fastidiosus TaxID=392011 RepID=A0ABY6ZDD0_9BACL|nr:CrcB family protein [Alicyclobacillus fastidiosus]WAH40563.1 CrcB family protein [Alicyclobacillus fastidiosus]GMA61998.1 hypothetical protein GCM10025859_24380 [Alicyclobacillus fastidiosus]
MKILSIFILGFIGGVTRFAFGDTLASILIVNAIGTLSLGILNSLCRTIQMKTCVEVGIRAGFIGSFTSFSALMIDAVRLYPEHTLDALGGIAIALCSISLYTVGIGLARYGLKQVGLEDTSDNDEQSTRKNGSMITQSMGAFREKL